jgi:secreted PhoX family phosphatase
MSRYNNTLAAALLGTTAFAGPAAAELARLASVPVGAEITGLYLTDAGDLFMNVQHPATAITGPYNKATVGYIADADFNGLPAEIEPLSVPQAQHAKQTVNTALGEYQILAQEGDFSDVVPGGLGAIIAADGSVLKSSNDPDFNGFIPSGENEGYLFTNWEDRPGGMSRMKLVRDEDGHLIVGKALAPQGEDTDSAEVLDVMMVDFTNVGGTWVNCFGSVSPWNTPLTSEELYFEATEDWNDPSREDNFNDAQMTRDYMGEATNPYDYGYIVEITDPTGTPTPVKHYTMGRYSHENAVVMPDQRTAYLSDDGTDVVFFKFVADEAGDLSSGTLYAAKATQQGDPGSDAATTGFDIEWIELAHASDDEIKGWISEYAGKPNKVPGQEGSDYITEEEIAAWANGKAEDDRVAFLESRRAAAAKGATAEFRKMEGTMINVEAVESGTAPYVYMSMSEVAEGMADDQGDVQLAENPCGVVYQMRLDDNYNVNQMVPAVAGGPYDENNAPNACSVDAISNPDNLIVLDDGRLVIGEDTGLHENNMLWIWTPPQA